MEYMMKYFTKFFLVLLMMIGYTFAAEITVGDTLHAFSATDHTGNLWHSDSTDSEYLVVYFYPAAMTFGCTKQACSYRDNMQEFRDLNADIIGVSGDEVDALQVFKREHDLNFTLLSDNEGKVAEIFGVPVSDGGEISKKINGEEVVLKRGVTTRRWTFVLDNQGKIIYKDDGVNPLADAKNVLKELQKE
jgi:peroxiredoxin Q/BCP